MSPNPIKKGDAPRPSPRPEGHRPGDRPVKNGLFERLLTALKLGIGVFMIGFVVLVGIMVAMAFNLFSSPRVYELDVVGLPPGSYFVGLIAEDGETLLPHNLQFSRAGAKTDNEVTALHSKKSLVAPGAFSTSLPLAVDPRGARAIVVVLDDGRIERCQIPAGAIEGSGGRLRVDISRTEWTEVEEPQMDTLRRWASSRLDKPR